MINSRNFISILCACLMIANIVQGQTTMFTKAEVEEEAKFVEGVKQQILGHHDKAIEIFEKLWQSDNRNANVAFELSRSYEVTKEFGKAIEFAQKAISIDNNNEFYYMQLAESYEGDGQISKAAETYHEFTRIDPQDPFFYEKAIYYYLTDGSADKAIDILDQMEQKFGADELLTKQKFEIYSKTDRPKKAAAELQKLINTFPKNIQYRLNLASYYLGLNDIKSAKKVYEELLVIDPNNETATTFFNMESNVDNPDLKYLYAIGVDWENENLSLDDKILKFIPVLQSIAEKNDTTTAKVAADMASDLAKMYPEEAKAHAVLGDTYMLSNQYENAVDAYSKTISLNASVFDVWKQVLEAEYILGRYKDLNERVEEGLMRFPNQGVLYVYGGIANNYLQNYPEAVDFLTEAKYMIPKGSDLREQVDIQLAKNALLNSPSKSVDWSNYSISDKNVSSENLVLQILINQNKNQTGKAKEGLKKARRMYPYHRVFKDLEKQLNP